MDVTLHYGVPGLSGEQANWQVYRNPEIGANFGALDIVNSYYGRDDNNELDEGTNSRLW